MKKRVLIFVCLLVCINSVIFGQNNQKMWSVDSDVYKYISYLYVAEGHALPNAAGPWSTQELKDMIFNLPGDFKNPNSQELYDKIDGILNEECTFTTNDGLGFTIHGIINPEVYVHTNKEDFTQEDDWYYDFEKRQKLLNAEFQLYLTDFFYAYVDMDMGYSSYAIDGVVSPLYQPTVICNVPFVTGQVFNYMSSNFPTRAFMSAGGEHWNISAGRDVLRWGYGETGNLFLGGTQVYDNNIFASFFYNNFKFSFASIFYPHPQSVLHADNQNVSIDGLSVFLTHRVDVRLFKDKVNLGLSEAIMYQSATNTLDLRVLNPMVISHSLYIRANANSMFCTELNYTPIPGLNFYGQMLLDELAVLGEPTEESEVGGHPNKMGYMLGSKYMLPLSEGVLKISLEGVYTDPCTYLREKYNEETQQFGVSFYSYLREFQDQATPSITYLRKCVGYVYGGDSIVGDLKVTFDSLEKWDAGLECFYMVHGVMYKDLGSDANLGDWTYKKMSTPCTEDVTCQGENGSGVPEHFLRISLSGRYDILSWLKVDGGIDNWLIWNKNNQPKPLVYDLQFHAGVKIYK